MEEEEVGRMVLVDDRLKALDVAWMMVLKELVEAEAEDLVGRPVEAEVNTCFSSAPFYRAPEKFIACKSYHYESIYWTQGLLSLFFCQVGVEAELDSALESETNS